MTVKRKVQDVSLITSKIEEMSDKVNDYENGATDRVSKKTYNGLKRTIDLFIAIELFMQKEPFEFIASDSDNLGTITEAVVASFLKKVTRSKAAEGATDLTTGGKRFDIKLLVKGSSSLPSSIDLDTIDDILIVSNLGCFIVRRDKIALAYDLGYMKQGENKLKPSVLGWEHCIETRFTKRLTKVLGNNVW